MPLWTVFPDDIIVTYSLSKEVTQRLELFGHIAAIQRVTILYIGCYTTIRRDSLELTAMDEVMAISKVTAGPG